MPSRQPLTLVSRPLPEFGSHSDPRQNEAHATIDVQNGRLMRMHFDYVADESSVHLRTDVVLDGSHFATLLATRRPDGPHAWELLCSLPARSARENIEVECYDADEQRLIFAHDLLDPPLLVNGQGLLASDVYSPGMHALFSAPWLEFDGAYLTVSGAHLPPNGDPDLLTVEFADGVSGSFEYPLPSPEFGEHYWYWPNGHMSGFRVRINLPESTPGSDAFTFRFAIKVPSKSHPVKAAAAGAADVWPDRSRLWIPHDLRAFMGFPSNENQMTRVQTWSNQRTVTFTGYNAFKGFESLAKKHGISRCEGLQVLDWGCGHGRVTRHFIENWPEAHISGTDIDPENIEWCQKHLPGGTFDLAPLLPPLGAPDGSYDLIVGLSVMTHLTAKVQEAWINEINRLLKPGGLALITFGGYAAAAFASAHQSPSWWRDWQENGFDDTLLDPALGGRIDDPTYYRVTHQSPPHTRAAWSRVMTVEDIKSQAFGYQDVAVLRAR